MSDFILDLFEHCASERKAYIDMGKKIGFDDQITEAYHYSMKIFENLIYDLQLDKKYREYLEANDLI